MRARRQGWEIHCSLKIGKMVMINEGDEGKLSILSRGTDECGWGSCLRAQRRWLLTKDEQQPQVTDRSKCGHKRQKQA